MAIKEFKYRGHTLNDLKAMDENKLIAIAPSNVKRKLTRGMKLDKKIKRTIKSNDFSKAVRTHKRDIVILPNMVGMKFSVYTGKTFELVDVKEEMLWHFLGEFVDTRKRPVHSKAGIGATRSSKNVGKK